MSATLPTAPASTARRPQAKQLASAKPARRAKVTVPGFAANPLRAIRLKCLECCCGSVKAVKYCTCDGTTSTKCDIWPFRFGKRVATAIAKYGPELLDPKAMPEANKPLYDLP